MALVPHAQELQHEVETVQQLRRTLHDAYIAEAKAGHRSHRDVTKAPSAMETHRTVDAPTLNILKSPNYPFNLCEEAPPSYVPPPVPYDVEGEIESLKQRVLEVQEAFQNFQRRHTRAGTPLSASQVLDFFSHNATFAEMAWEVSSLQWFYRWVLSHSISHLWNCKEQLEYVLTEHETGLPQSVEEMDACLQEYPFSAAVSILDSDRQAVVAQERRRLRSISRTFRERVPAACVTAATSCYLTAEEKYMYQEFFNQSEHMLLLLNHTLMLNKASGAAAPAAIKAAPERTGSGRAAMANSQSQTPGRASSQDSGALLLPSESAVAEMDTAGLAEETLNAVAAEQEVIATLMHTIHERQQRGEFFEVSAAEQERSRRAQIAVYGCVLSDMSLMAHQMNLTVEFMEHYEKWLKLRGSETHDELMSALSKRSGGTAWPSLSQNGVGNGADSGHGHFVPPSELMMRFYRPQERPTPSEPMDGNSKRAASETRRALPRNAAASAAAPAAPASAPPPAPAPAPAARTRAPPPAPSSTSAVSLPSTPPVHASTAQQPPPPATPAVTRPRAAAAPPATVPEAPPAAVAADTAAPPRRRPSRPVDEHVVVSPASAPLAGSPAAAEDAVGNALYAILLVCAHAASESPAETATVAEQDAALSRAWLVAAVRYAAVKLLRREWVAAEVAKGMSSSEDVLLGLVGGRKSGFSRLTSTAAALCVVVQEVARLCVARSSLRSLTVEVGVPVQVPANADDYAAAVRAVAGPAEQQRWGAVLDAVWFQVDPSSAASGGLLFQAIAADGDVTGPVPSNQRSAMHFLYIESIEMPAAAVASGDASMVLRYRLPRMCPAAETSRRVAPTLAAAADAQPSSKGGLARYLLARRALAAFFEVEAKGLLPCFATRVAEARAVPVTQMVYVAFDDGNTSSVVDKNHVPHLCLLPPAAMALRRMEAAAGTAQAATAACAEPINFSSIALMIGGMLEDMAARAPVMQDLYMTAATMLEQAAAEVKSGATPRAFANASTHPKPIACAPTKTRAISIQRESTAKRNSVSMRRFVAPLLRRLEDTIAALESGVTGSNNASVHSPASPTASASFSGRPHAAPPAAGVEPQPSVTGRQTQLGGVPASAPSPSPSAVRPTRR